jgi:polyferredoxin
MFLAKKNFPNYWDKTLIYFIFVENTNDQKCAAKNTRIVMTKAIIFVKFPKFSISDSFGSIKIHLHSVFYQILEKKEIFFFQNLLSLNSQYLTSFLIFLNFGGTFYTTKRFNFKP